jgi:ATP-dependent RNA helicase SUPV3L1/SUV3
MGLVAGRSCGDGSAVQVVKRICDEMDEPFEVRQYERFSPLGMEESALVGGYSGVRGGDCVVAFSRRDIYEIKQEIERSTKLRASVVYGALPPETRRQQVGV